jgi:hypothetical protein
VDRIDIDGSDADQVSDREEVVGSGDIGAEKVVDPDGFVPKELLNGGANWIGAIDEGVTDQNDVDDADVDLDGDEEEL